MSRQQQPAGREYTPAAGPGQTALARNSRELNELLPAVPGTPHPDPFLAARGWQTCGHGIYVRRDPQRETGREAG
jgi:hypothetical protein